ncbi:solute carrier family 2, facilitated glucose transporter member 8-like isoform X2 [Thrips palmi]|uniref:Solute carrier family 2, facilitated glucose transporter member 8-like isoform X2 n=1 Tax=Thrips palmi TaxID=161013 RepID=A0A6P9A937_THRPL|nr:solute carrier family 2, facilitated glucose transporter member 8-like isoform X2 [Thrips palmi]
MSLSRSTDCVLPPDMQEERVSARAATRQILSTLSAGLACVAVGSCLGWPSPILDRMSSKHWRWPGVGLERGGGLGPPRPLSTDEASWVVSLMDLGIVLGSLPAGWAADRWGRRPVLLSCAPMFVASWLLVLAAQGPEFLYAARLLQGLASSVAMVVTAMYAGEVSDDGLRGANSAMVAMLLTLGTVVSYSVGPYVTYRAFAVSLLGVPALFVLCFCWAPESPYWLLVQGRRLEAEHALRYLRDAGSCPLRVCAEADRIEAGIMEASDAAARSSPSSASSGGLLASFRELLVVPGPDRAAFALVITLTSLQALSGSDPMTAYSAVTLPNGFVLGANEVVIFFGVVSTLSTGVGAVLMDRAGRRPLLIAFSALQFASLLASAVYYTLDERTTLDMSVPEWVWVPPAALVLYGVSYPIGLGCVPNTLQVELFSTRVKGVALPAILVSFNALTFLVSKLYQVVWDAWGKDVAFWFFTADCLLAVVVATALLKETKGKSFPEIQDLLDSRRKRRSAPTWPS